MHLEYRLHVQNYETLWTRMKNLVVMLVMHWRWRWWCWCWPGAGAGSVAGGLEDAWPSTVSIRREASSVAPTISGWALPKVQMQEIPASRNRQLLLIVRASALQKLPHAEWTRGVGGVPRRFRLAKKMRKLRRESGLRRCRQSVKNTVDAR